MYAVAPNAAARAASLSGEPPVAGPESGTAARSG
jgi:hypothetical protein